MDRVHALFDRDDGEDEHERHDEDPSRREQRDTSQQGQKQRGPESEPWTDGAGIGRLRIVAPPRAMSGAGEAVTLDVTAGTDSWATGGVAGAERT